MSVPAESQVAFFDLFDPEFRLDSLAVRAAAEANWYAQTSMGVGVLQYDAVRALHGEVG